MRSIGVFAVVVMALACFGQEPPPSHAAKRLDFAGVAKLEGAFEQKLKTLDSNDAVALLGATLAFPGSTTVHPTTPPVPLVLAAPSAAVGTIGGLVPDETLGGQTGTTTARALRPALLAVAQTGCACTAALAHLAEQAASYGLTVYLIGSQAQHAELASLATGGNPVVQVLTDQGSAVTSAFSRGTLTVVGVHADGVIEVIIDDFLRTTSLDGVLGGLKQPAHAGA